MSEVAQVLHQVQERLMRNPDRVAGLQAAFQFDLTGEGGGTYHMAIADGKVRSGEGPAEGANLVITMAARDFLDLAAGRFNPTQAFMTGRLKLKGDMGLALRLQNLLS